MDTKPFTEIRKKKINTDMHNFVQSVKPQSKFYRE